MTALSNRWKTSIFIAAIILLNISSYLFLFSAGLLSSMKCNLNDITCLYKLCAAVHGRRGDVP
jgi:hypothetical protein